MRQVRAEDQTPALRRKGLTPGGTRIPLWRGGPGAAIRRCNRLDDILFDGKLRQLPGGQGPDLREDHIRVTAEIGPGARRIHGMIL
jgi:hypothetical protein